MAHRTAAGRRGIAVASKADDAAQKTSSKPERAKMASESFLRSAVSLLVMLAGSVWWTTLFDHTKEAQQASEWMLTTMWTTPHSVAYITVSVYFCIVIWHLYLRSAESKAAAKANESSLINGLLIGWNYFLTALSFVMLAGLTRGAYSVASEHGAWHTQVCHGRMDCCVRAVT